MLLFHKINFKRFVLAFIIVSILTGISYLSMLGSGKGVLPYLFLIFRFPTHTWFWETFNDSSNLYRIGLVINVFFWSFVAERIFAIGKLFFPAQLREPTDAEKAEFMIKFNDMGLFHYEDDSFIYGNGDVKIEWLSVKKIVAFKRDLMTFDVLCLAIFFEESFFELNEETPGWYQFLIKLREVFPTIPERWESAVLFPPFATNETILYEKTNTSV